MYDVSEFLFNLEKKGVKISEHNGELKVNAPKGFLTPEIQKLLSEKKTEILNFLLKRINQLNSKSKETIMDFSLFFFASDDTVDENDKYRFLIEGAKFADDNGFTAVWTPERHFHKMGGLFPNPSITAAALSTITKNIKLRAGSVVLPLHDPVRVAEEWSVVDNLSNGRVELSFATGWHVDDFVFAPEGYPERKQIMFNEIETVKKLWRGGSIIRKGGAGNPVEIRTRPRPVQVELPIWVTAIGNPETYKKAGEIGANLMTCLLDQDIDELTEKLKIYHSALITNGFNPDQKKVAAFMHSFMGENMDEVRNTVHQPLTNYLKSTLDLLGNWGNSANIELNPKNMTKEDQNTLMEFAFERYFNGRTLMGTSETCSKMVEALAKAGVNEIACLVDFGVSFSDSMKSLDYLNKFKQQFTLK